MTDFENFIKSRVVINQSELEQILCAFSRKTIEKGQLILKRGQTAHQYFYIQSGTVRFFFGEFDAQLTAWVIFKNEFFAEISSLNPQKPTRFNIEATEKTELLCISKADMDRLYQQFPVWQEFGRKLWEEMSIRMIDRILTFQTKTAEEHYLEYLNTPDFLQKVPVNQIASYLGITPNALSRIRKNIK
ncbi:Crp/Fnr family transcriptional regulator [Mucilaginibacter gilvus]|uniref:Crp/Fnr family transcriptional regulator n=2 Tax=Mucilaginibacter gilvus TaxID=2305909 RepID=A0A3S4Y4P9_9SPHI|nr:Crp/Fnr family transcriptional regulator [Mucilaginibacter gilvus]